MNSELGQPFQNAIVSIESILQQCQAPFYAISAIVNTIHVVAIRSTPIPLAK